ncbi:MAG: hypothetical protein QM784_07580 [Polyangiaceae bacterium]
MARTKLVVDEPLDGTRDASLRDSFALEEPVGGHRDGTRERHDGNVRTMTCAFLCPREHRKDVRKGVTRLGVLVGPKYDPRIRSGESRENRSSCIVFVTERIDELVIQRRTRAPGSCLEILDDIGSYGAHRFEPTFADRTERLEPLGASGIARRVAQERLCSTLVFPYREEVGLHAQLVEE